MKLTAKEDISAPIEHVFAAICEADRMERLVRKRGGKIDRTPQGPLEQGTQWSAEVAFRGNKRKLAFCLDEMTGPETLKFSGGSDGMGLTVNVELVALSPHTTRLSVESEAKPKTLAARLLIQSAKLARGIMLTKYRQRISDYAADIERNFKTS